MIMKTIMKLSLKSGPEQHKSSESPNLGDGDTAQSPDDFEKCMVKLNLAPYGSNRWSHVRTVTSVFKYYSSPRAVALLNTVEICHARV